MQANFYWVQGQEFQETFCIPSEGIQYRDSLANPSGDRDGDPIASRRRGGVEGRFRGAQALPG